MRGTAFAIATLALACSGCVTAPPASQTKEAVEFRSSPSGAELYVDGERLGVTPIRDATISKATHRVTLRKPGYAEFTTYIAPRPRNPFVHLFTLGFLLNTGEFDALDSSYTFTLSPNKTDQK